MNLDESTGSEGRCSSACNSFFEYLRIPLTKMNSGQGMMGFGILGFGMMAQFGRLKSGRFACIPNTRILYGKKGGRKKNCLVHKRNNILRKSHRTPRVSNMLHLCFRLSNNQFSLEHRLKSCKFTRRNNPLGSCRRCSGLAEPEVEQLGVAGRSEHHVLRLQVAVGEATLMDSVDRLKRS